MCVLDLLFHRIPLFSKTLVIYSHMFNSFDIQFGLTPNKIMIKKEKSIMKVFTVSVCICVYIFLYSHIIYIYI